MAGLIFLELKRYIRERSFWLSSLLICALCFTQECEIAGGVKQQLWFFYVHMDYIFPKTSMGVYSIHEILMQDVSYWLSVLIPMICACSFAPLYLTEKHTQYFRHRIMRTGRFRIHIARFVAVVTASGLCVLIGYMMFVVLLSWRFPMFWDYPEAVQMQYLKAFEREHISADGLMISIVEKYGVIGIYLIRFVEMFLYGILSTLPALVLCVWISNSYLVSVSPFLWTYCIAQAGAKLMEYAYRNPDMPMPWMEELGYVMQPQLCSKLLTVPYMKGQTIYYNVFIIVLSLAAYLTGYFRRIDRGEG